MQYSEYIGGVIVGFTMLLSMLCRLVRSVQHPPSA